MNIDSIIEKHLNVNEASMKTWDVTYLDDKGTHKTTVEATTKLKVAPALIKKLGHKKFMISDMKPR